jgi:uncharacterized membrane protein
MTSSEMSASNTQYTRSLGSGRRGSSEANVSRPERWVAGVAGGVLLACGLRRPSWRGVLLTLGGGGLLHCAATGRSLFYELLGVSTTHTTSGVASVRHMQGIKLERSVTISKPPEELYRFWRKLGNLPRFMEHLESVRTIDDTRSHWVAKAPGGTRIEWEAEIYNDKENELIAWRSLQNADVNNAGSVHFTALPDGRGTEVRVVINYEPPAGRLGAAVAKLLGEDPARALEEDLVRFKQLMEAGEVPAVTAQDSRLV